MSLPGEKAEEGEEPVGPVRQKHLLKVGEDLRDQEYRASGCKEHNLFLYNLSVFFIYVKLFFSQCVEDLFDCE